MNIILFHLTICFLPFLLVKAGAVMNADNDNLKDFSMKYKISLKEFLFYDKRN